MAVYRGEILMRIYEIAKQYKKSSKDIIALLQKKGFDPKNHMAVLGDKEIAALKLAFQGTKEVLNSGQQTKKPVSKKQRVDSSKSTFHKNTQSVEQRAVKPKLKERAPEPVLVSQGIIVEPMLVGTVAEKLGLSASEVIITLLGWGIVSAKNQVISADIVERLAQHYNAHIIPLNEQKKTDVIATASPSVSSEELIDRLPVVVIVGHVDHGKTSLLDYIRKTRVADREKGGITQHIGAYEATTSHGNIIFIDTPGHEAFSKMRERGVRIADIAILIVAADDGVMPQTVEAIKHIKESNVPIVVAITKMDKADDARIEVIKRQLSSYGIFSEDWGGDVVCVPVSSKTGAGIDELLEMIVLQSQILELRAEGKGYGKGYILESKLEKGRGPVATLIGKHGRIAVGDYFVCGNATGHITSIVDSSGVSRTSIGPSIPVQVAGFDSLAQVGDYFHVVSKEEYRKAKAAHEYISTIDSTYKNASESSVNLVIKTDTNSSCEALIDAINALSQRAPIHFNVIDASVGIITEGDIELAYNTNANIIAFHTKPENKAITLAQRRGVVVSYFGIIYKLLEHLEAYAESKKERVAVFTKQGEALVLRVFDIKGVGVIAGCRVTSGKFTRQGKVVVWRGDEKIGEGKLTSLQREKRSVKEAIMGTEFGFSAEGLDNFQPDDRIEFFVEASE